MTRDLVPVARFEQDAAVLVERYAGFVDAGALTLEERVASLLSLLPMALQVVDEARDTIERLNAENAALRRADEAVTEDAVEEGPS